MPAKPCDRCGKPVSENKGLCLPCIEETAANIVTAKNEEPMENATHVMINFPAMKEFGDKPHRDLYRADGLLVASCHDDRVLFGHDISTAQSRLFLTPEMAVAFLRRMADVDLVCEQDGVALADRVNNYALIPKAAVIEERDTEPSLIVAPGNRSLIRAN